MGVHRDADDADTNVRAEFVDEGEVRREIEIVRGGAGGGGQDFIERNIPNMLESVDRVDGDKVLVLFRKVEFVGIRETERVLGQGFFESRLEEDRQSIEGKIGIAKEVNEHRCTERVYGLRSVWL